MCNESIDFRKYDALGNDYLVIDPNHCRVNLTWDSIRLLCDRHHGIGSDGILLGPIRFGSEFGLRIFNPDGTECEKSGNGLRIFARALVDAGYVAPSSFSIKLLHSGESIGIQCMDQNARLIRVDMGSYSLSSSDFPCLTGVRQFLDELIVINGMQLRISCVDVGNPHCVVLGQSVTSAIAKTLGPLICEHPLFPNRTNVQFAEVISRDAINIEIWERGAGYTIASGSSSCAVAAACFELGLINREVEITMPGGRIKVEICEDKRILLTGPVLSVAHGSFAFDLKNKISDQKLESML